MGPTTIMVVGTAAGSFGAKLYDAFAAEMSEEDEYSGWSLVPAGVPRQNEKLVSTVEYDVTWPLARHYEVMRAVKPYHVIYAVGMNLTDTEGVLGKSAELHFELNARCFLDVAQAFKTVAFPGSQLVAVSSNSARIPRSPSLGYCMSKAALSMAVRVLARRWKGEPMVWGLEPGLMNTDATIASVNANTYAGRAHRMQGVMSTYGLNADQVAETVAHSVLWGGMHLNGALLQMDAGEV